MLETGKDLDPQSCEILQTYVWWGVGGGGASFQHISLKPGKFTNFNKLVSLVSMDFR